jgi:FkbM family methyltransferase
MLGYAGRLSCFARMARAVSFPGKDKLLRLVYPPDKRSNDHVTEIIAYDEGLMRVTTSSYIEWFLYFNRYYEAHLTKVLQSLVKENSVCLDVGANIGCHTLTMAHRAKHGKVYAFEPNPPIFDRLMFNIRLNNLKNVTALNCAISDNTGETSLFVPDTDDCNKGKCSMTFSQARGNINAVKIRALRVSDLDALQHLKRCDVIKIDVEGFESIVIKELVGLINEFLPAIIFEYDVHNWGLAKASLEDIRGLLDRYVMVDLTQGMPLPPREVQDGDILCLPK